MELSYSENILPSSNCVAVIMPGLGGYKELPYVKAIEKAMWKNNISTLSFDPLNSLGKSSGNFENATFDSHLESLKIAINIAKSKCPDKKLIIVGHSVSAMVVLWYSANIGDIDYTISFAPLISGKLYENPKNPDKKREIEKWKEVGYRLKSDKDGKEHKVLYSFVNSLQKIDLTKEVKKIKVPVLLIANEKDKTTNAGDLELLSKSLNKKSKFVIIPEAPHMLKEKEQLEILEKYISDFVGRINDI